MESEVGSPARCGAVRSAIDSAGGGRSQPRRSLVRAGASSRPGVAVTKPPAFAWVYPRKREGSGCLLFPRWLCLSIPQEPLPRSSSAPGRAWGCRWMPVGMPMGSKWGCW